MTIDPDEIRHHYELLSDESLLATKRDDLVAAAQAIYDEEIEKRGLNKPAAPAAPETEAEAAPETAAEPAVEDLVSVGSFTVVDEARFARGLLQGGQVPCGLINDKADPAVLLLMVPESFVDAALEILAGEISDEELAAQAEAAGFQEEEEPEE